jgi:hypothetical protein
MATLTPARITYFLGDAEQDVRFHSVISEAHQATSEITKYPVQSGFQISNHAIRHNRKVTIEAIISNTLIERGATSYQYSLSDNSRAIFDVLRDLVNLKIKTTVLTNLGTYTPVVFTSFKTKQVAGMVDAMKVLLVGEELQVSEAINGSAPSPVSWTQLTPEASAARMDELRNAGVNVDANAILSEAKVDMGGDFSIENLTSTGVAVVTSYINTGQDLVTGAYSYAVHTTDTFLEGVADVVEEVAGGDLSSLLEAGVSGVSDCLANEATDLVVDTATDKIETAMGSLTKSAYGAFYGITHMSESDVGQSLIGLTTGCVVRGVTGFTDQFSFQPGESLPSVDDIIQGALKFGENTTVATTATGVATTSTTLTRIECAC